MEFKKMYERDIFPLGTMQDIVNEHLKTKDIKYLFNAVDYAKKYMSIETIKTILDYSKNQNRASCGYYSTLIDACKSAIYEIKHTRTTISACMIVKDETYLIDGLDQKRKRINLRECIFSFLEYVDELIICDTGSSDRTIKMLEIIAKNNQKVKVIKEKWVNFSHNRNLVAKQASKEWVLIIDADERILDASKLKSVLREAAALGCNAVKFKMYDIKESGVVGSFGETNARLVKTDCVYCYGAAHNQIVGFAGVHSTDKITLMHYGYRHGTEKRDKRYKQTAHLLKKDLKGAKNEASLCYIHYKLAEVYMMMEMQREAMDHIWKSMKHVSNTTTNFMTSVLYLAVILHGKFKYKVAAYYLNELILKLDPMHVDASWVMCAFSKDFKNQRFIDAVKAYLVSVNEHEFNRISEAACYHADDYVSVLKEYSEKINNSVDLDVVFLIPFSKISFSDESRQMLYSIIAKAIEYERDDAARAILKSMSLIDGYEIDVSNSFLFCKGYKEDSEYVARMLDKSNKSWYTLYNAGVYYDSIGETEKSKRLFESADAKRLESEKEA